MIIVRCKQCNTEVKSNSQSKTCGCPNMLTITGDTSSEVDRTSIVVVRTNKRKERDGLTSQDRAWKEQRSKRKIGKVELEVGWPKRETHKNDRTTLKYEFMILWIWTTISEYSICKYRYTIFF